jgi:hypothetical protein
MFYDTQHGSEVTGGHGVYHKQPDGKWLSTVDIQNNDHI